MQCLPDITEIVKSSQDIDLTCCPPKPKSAQLMNYYFFFIFFIQVLRLYTTLGVMTDLLMNYSHRVFFLAA